MTNRLTWDDLPEPVRRRVHLHLGAEVVSTTSCSGGFSPSTAEIVVGENGRRLFVKAVRAADNPDSIDLNRAEARALTRMPVAAPVPRLVGVFDEGDWLVLVTEAAEGALPALPWDRGDLDHVLEALDVLEASATPCPVPGLPSVPDVLGDDMHGFDRVAADPPASLDPWVAEHLDELRAAAVRGIAKLAGDTLCHSDLRADNLLIAPGGKVAIVDWAWASRGSRVADALQLLSSIDDPTGGLQLSARVDEVLDRHGLPPHVGTDVLAGILGFFVDAARLPVPPSLPPGLPAHRVARRDGLLPLVKERWGRGW